MTQESRRSRGRLWRYLVVEKLVGTVEYEVEATSKEAAKREVISGDESMNDTANITHTGRFVEVRRLD